MLTMSGIHALAVRWTPPKARFDSMLVDRDSWGPAHELGHALVEPRSRHAIAGYGRCSLGFCRCRGESCNVFELAAMLVSSRLMFAAKRSDLVDDETQHTTDLDLVTPKNVDDAERLIRRLKLWPIPRTFAAVSRECQRRLS